MIDLDITSDASRFDVKAIHTFLSTSYWSPGISLSTVQRAIKHSLCFGVLTPDGAQIGFARVITDRTTFAYLADVYVQEAYRGQGIARRLIQYILAHPELQNLRRMMLVTRDAHRLYAGFGFQPAGKPERIMERCNADAHLRRHDD